MKLNNVIILTIADFRRNFSFPAFWNSRMSFIRDMNPKKMSYSTPEDMDNFEKISTWIRAEYSQTVTDELRKFGLTALSLFAKCNVTEKDLKKVIGMLDYTADIIVVESGGILRLPGQIVNAEETMTFANTSEKKERIHKIETDGDNSDTALILIGDEEIARLSRGECVYVTEINGDFRRILPNSLSEGPYTLTMENIPGSFECDVMEEYNSMTGREVTPRKGVTQFAFTKKKPSRPIYASDKYYVLND